MPSDAELLANLMRLNRLRTQIHMREASASAELAGALEPDPATDAQIDGPSAKASPRGKRGQGRALKAPVPTEREEQKALFAWSVAARWQYSEIETLFAIPNGSHRHPAVAAKLKAEGVRAGIPDLFLPCARKRPDGSVLHGCWIELKRRDGGRVSYEQARWHGTLTRLGYHVAVCRGWESARDAIVAYLNLAPAP